MTRNAAIYRLITDVYRYADFSENPNENEFWNAFDMAIEALEKEPKTGHWNVVSDGYGDNSFICECSECKNTVWVYKDESRKWKYCPDCGAKMEE